MEIFILFREVEETLGRQCDSFQKRDVREASEGDAKDPHFLPVQGGEEPVFELLGAFHVFGRVPQVHLPVRHDDDRSRLSVGGFQDLPGFLHCLEKVGVLPVRDDLAELAEQNGVAFANARQIREYSCRRVEGDEGQPVVVVQKVDEESCSFDPQVVRIRLLHAAGRIDSQNDVRAVLARVCASRGRQDYEGTKPADER